MTPRASDQNEQRNDLTEEMRLENDSDLARAFFTSAVLAGVPLIRSTRMYRVLEKQRSR